MKVRYDILLYFCEQIEKLLSYQEFRTWAQTLPNFTYASIKITQRVISQMLDHLSAFYNMHNLNKQFAISILNVANTLGVAVPES